MAFDHWEETADSPTRDVTPIGQSAMRKGLIEYQYLDDLINYVFPLGDFGIAYPGNSALRASQLHAEPFGGDGAKVLSPVSSNLSFDTINTVEKLLVTINYETPQASPDDQGEDPQVLLMHRWSIGGEVVVPSAGGFEWDDGGKVGKEVKPGIIVPTIEHQITWPRVESPPFAIIRDRIGTVNDAVLMFKTGQIEPETLMFLGAELNRDILTTGALAWELGYHFSEKRVVALTIEASLTTQVACEANDGIWNSDTSKCSLQTVGGHNHFYRSEDNEDTPELEGKNGWYRIRTKPLFDDALTTELACTAGDGVWDATLERCVIGGRDPVFRLTDFDALFEEAA